MLIAPQIAKGRISELRVIRFGAAENKVRLAKRSTKQFRLRVLTMTIVSIG